MDIIEENKKKLYLNFILNTNRTSRKIPVKETENTSGLLVAA